MLRMTHAELHALVWSKPMTEVARNYGIRDQHVAQACDAHDIARPRAGHWQRVEHGMAVETVTLELGITRQTLYRFVSPTGELRYDGKRLLGRRAPRAK